MYEQISDIILILVSSSACLYCFMLSRRLKKLQNLDDGLGASILSLTEAITQTANTAKSARQATEENIQVLRKLLRDAEDTLPQVEARIESLSYSRKAAKMAHQELETILSSQIKPEINNAKQVSRSLLQIVTEIEDYRKRTHAIPAIRDTHDIKQRKEQMPVRGQHPIEQVSAA